LEKLLNDFEEILKKVIKNKISTEFKNTFALYLILNLEKDIVSCPVMYFEFFTFCPKIR
jgi:hypothetical protein